MNKYILLSICFIFSLLISSVSLASTFVDPSSVGVGARPLALGRAYIGLADDVSSIFIDPAGLATVHSLAINSMGATLIGDVNYTVLGAAIPLGAGTFGIGFVNSAVTSIPLTSWTNSGGVNRPQIYGSTDYNSDLILLTYAADLARPPKPGIIKSLQAGASLKYFNQGFSETSGPMDGGAGSGINLDLGIKAEIQNWLHAGIVLNNILPDGLGGGFRWIRDNVKEDMPASVKIGTAIKLIGREGLRQIASSEVNFVLDSECPLNGNIQRFLFHAGVEYWPVKYLALRAGLDQQQSAASSGSGLATETDLTAGVGIRISGFTFDYAYHQYGDLTENATHYFSFGIIL